MCTDRWRWKEENKNHSHQSHFYLYILQSNIFHKRRKYIYFFFKVFWQFCNFFTCSLLRNSILQRVPNDVTLQTVYTENWKFTSNVYLLKTKTNIFSKNRLIIVDIFTLHKYSINDLFVISFYQALCIECTELSLLLHAGRYTVTEKLYIYLIYHIRIWYKAYTKASWLYIYSFQK